MITQYDLLHITNYQYPRSEVVHDTESMDGVEYSTDAEEISSDEGSEADQGFDASTSFDLKKDSNAEDMVQDNAGETKMEGTYQYRHESWTSSRDYPKMDGTNHYAVDNDTLSQGWSEDLWKMNLPLPSQAKNLLQKLYQRDSIRPSSVVKRLILKFQFDDYRDWREYPVTSEDVTVSLDTMLQNCAVKEISHEGILYQEILNRIAGALELKSLVIREAWPRGSCVYQGDEFPTGFNLRPLGHAVLDLQPIIRLQCLSTLRISNLLPNEGHGLARAVGGLPVLEDLHISVAFMSGPYATVLVGTPALTGITNSPLDEFLMAMYSPLLAEYGFPNSLKSLTLVDRDFRLVARCWS